MNFTGSTLAFGLMLTGGVGTFHVFEGAEGHWTHYLINYRVWTLYFIYLLFYLVGCWWFIIFKIIIFFNVKVCFTKILLWLLIGTFLNHWFRRRHLQAIVILCNEGICDPWQVNSGLFLLVFYVHNLGLNETFTRGENLFWHIWWLNWQTLRLKSG